MPLSQLRLKPPGLAPGSAVFAGRQKVERTTMRLVDFSEGHLEERDDVGLDDIRRGAMAQTVTWIDLVGLHEVEKVKALCEIFAIHPLTLEDILNPRSRSKLEEFETYVFFTMKVAHLDASQRDGIQQEAVSVVLGTTFVLTFQEIEGDSWDPVRARLRQSIGRIRRMKSDYFAYALLDAVVDGYFLVIEQIGVRLQVLEDAILAEPNPRQHAQIHALRRLLLAVHRAAAPFRDVTSSFMRLTTPFVQKETKPFLRDVNDHSVQVVDELQLLRDRGEHLVDIFHAETNQRLNQATMLLSIISTIFLPLSFIAGVYGMNFKYMPEIPMKFGYPATLLLMLAVATGLITWFRKKGWL